MNLSYPYRTTGKVYQEKPKRSNQLYQYKFCYIIAQDEKQNFLNAPSSFLGRRISLVVDEMYEVEGKISDFPFHFIHFIYNENFIFVRILVYSFEELLFLWQRKVAAS